MRPIRCVLFDFGSTLFGHKSLEATIESCSAALGTALEPATAHDLGAMIIAAAETEVELSYGRDLDADVWMTRWRELYAIADDWVPGLGAGLVQNMHDPHAWIPFAQTAATLRQLRSMDIAVGVVSNTGWDVRDVFRAHHLHDCIDHYTLSYETGLAKPDLAIFAAACSALDMSAAETLMVGDDPRADGGAATAGLRTFLLPSAEPGSDNGIELAVLAVGRTGPRSAPATSADHASS